MDDVLVMDHYFFKVTLIVFGILLLLLFSGSQFFILVFGFHLAEYIGWSEGHYESETRF